MNRDAVVQRLQRVIGAAGRNLLDQFNLLTPLVEQMVTSEAIVDVVVSTDQLENARLDLLQQRGYDAIEQWGELLEALGCSNDEVDERLRQSIRRRIFIRERFEAADAVLERKNALDQVVYSLLRPENRFLAQELYPQIEVGESNFADLANVAEGPERNTNGIVGSVSLIQAHPTLVGVKGCSAGVRLNPSASRTGGQLLVGARAGHIHR